ncbi:hypothetical protein LJR220_003343 [Bradyrhizobium sp. LjRoot220]|uniref:hypothetical protein n=1 Tax=Bradyrhizobium sp. LjRoot220 TaxID=3342284 RepID=UPI003ED0365E
MTQATAQQLPNADKNNEQALTTRNTVTVACKMPHGVMIRDFAEGKVMEDVLGGGKRPTKVFRPVGRPIRVKGPVVPDQFIRLVEVVGGYAITEGVDARVFAKWIDANKEAPFVTNELIFGHENGDIVRGWAKEHAAVRSGMEPLDVTMKSERGRMVYSDERVRTAGADQVVDGKVEATTA